MTCCGGVGAGVNTFLGVPQQQQQQQPLVSTALYPSRYNQALLANGSRRRRRTTTTTTTEDSSDDGTNNNVPNFLLTTNPVTNTSNFIPTTTSTSTLRRRNLGAGNCCPQGRRCATGNCGNNNDSDTSNDDLERLQRRVGRQRFRDCGVAPGANELYNAGFTVNIPQGQANFGAVSSDNIPPCNVCSGNVQNQEDDDPGSSSLQYLYNPTTGETVQVNTCTGEIAGVHQKKKKKCKYPTVYIKKKKCKDDCDPCTPKEGGPCQQKYCCPPTHGPICLTHPPKRADCYASEPKAYKTLLNTYFDSFDVGTSRSNDWLYFTMSNGFIANDGVWTKNSRGLSYNAQPFRLTYPQVGTSPTTMGYLDHFKTFVYRNSEYCIPACGELYVEGHMTSQQSGQDADTMRALFHYPLDDPNNSQVFDAQADPRAAYACLTMIDMENWIAFHHVLTNDTFYAAIESLPFGRTDQGGSDPTSDYSPFMTIHPLGRRNSNNPLSRYHRHGIGFDRRLGVKWYIDGAVVHQRNLIGSPQSAMDILSQNPGSFREIQNRIRCVRVGFGNMNFLDGMNTGTGSIVVEIKNETGVSDPTVNQRTLINLRNVGYVPPTDPAPAAGVSPSLGNSTYNRNPTQYVHDTSTPEQRLFGQGSQVNIRQMLVQLRC